MCIYDSTTRTEHWREKTCRSVLLLMQVLLPACACNVPVCTREAFAALDTTDDVVHILEEPRRDRGLHRV